MTEIKSQKLYDLEERTYRFAFRIRKFTKELPKIMENLVDSQQLIRSSGSVGANYIEANDSLSRKDFFHRIKICRKEAKECKYWLRLVDVNDNQELEKEVGMLINEATELMNIFGSILKKNI